MRQLTLLVALAALPLAAQSPAKRPITESDIYRFRWVADPRISPDGRQVAYVLVTIDSARRGYETSIWAVAADGASPPRRLTSGPRDGAPRWSPDSRTLAFVRTAASARGQSAPQLWLLPMDGGEGTQLTDVPRGASAAVWSPDGRTIAFLNTSKPEDFPDSARRAADSLRASPAEAGPGGRPGSARDTTRALRESDVRVITRAVFRFNDAGYLDPSRHTHVWSVPAQPGPRGTPARATQLTFGEFDEGEVAWSPDGRRVYFTSDRVAEPYFDPPTTNLYAVPAAGCGGPAGRCTPEVVVDVDGPVGGAVPSPDGRAIAFTGFVNPPKVRSYDEGDVFVFRDGKATNLTESYDFDIGGGISGDQAPPRGGGGSAPLVWSADGRSVFTTTTEHGASNLVRLDAATGRRDALTTGNHMVLAYTATPNAARFALTMNDPTRLGEVYLLDAATKKLTQLTHENDSLFAALDLSPAEEFWYPSFDGRRIEGWIMKPPGFRPGTKYPMILQVHGGPHVAYGYAFTHEFQWMAAKGYVVVFTNPRGSTSYGQEFGNVIQYRYPGDDYKDLMVAVDTVLGRGYVDATKLGITGGSGGGLLTNWAVTQTKRFAAAVAQRSVADWQGFWYSADFTLFTPSWFRVPPYEDPSDYIARSPVRYASSITTPLMLVAGEEDYRTPPTQGDMAMFRALKAQKKPTVLVLFPNESHELSRSGQPRHRVERLQHIVGWFDKYLKGEGGGEYDR